MPPFPLPLRLKGKEREGLVQGLILPRGFKGVSPINLFEMKAVIKVIGVGGAGCNAVNRMIEAGLDGVDFVAANTDVQVLNTSLAPQKIQLGAHATRGLGSGGNPETGEASARETEKEILMHLEGADMVFIAAGMGGGTGTGAAPIIAELAKQRGILTVAVVSEPFMYEGGKRKKIAKAGLNKLKEIVDSLIVIPNDLLPVAVGKSVSFVDALRSADEALLCGVKGIADIVIRPGMINVDFADVKSVMTNAGLTVMGIGKGIGEKKARIAAQAAVQSPFSTLSIQGAQKMLVSFLVGPTFSMGEINEAMDYLNQYIDPETGDVFMGLALDEAQGDSVEVTVVAVGMPMEGARPQDPSVFQQADRSRGRDRSIVEEPDTAETTSAQVAPVREPSKVRHISPARGPLAPLDVSDFSDISMPEFLKQYKSSDL